MHSFKAQLISSCLALITSSSLVACVGADEGAPGDGALQSSAEELAKCPPPVPDPSLAVPAGNKLAFEYDAIGVQIYACQATATGFGWVFQAPEATLFDAHGRVAGKHYAGPTWEANDGSKVVGARVAGFSPDPASIPWLLLSAASHDGAGRMADVTYVQRLDTVGGLAPATGCEAADQVGAVARVDYTASYAFYEAGTPPCHCK